MIGIGHSSRPLQHESEQAAIIMCVRFTCATGVDLGIGSLLGQWPLRTNSVPFRPRHAGVEEEAC